MTSFWSWYITLLTLGTLVAMCWLIFATRKSEVHKDPTDQTMGHTFDGIEEYDNPMPKWWFMLFIATLIFAVLYLALYPGLGNYKGLLPGYEDGWTQDNQWQREMDRAHEVYGPLYAKFAAMPIEELAKDPQAVKMGARLFASNCSVCHGSDAKGSYGFPNLTDNEWRWGGEAAAIKTSILNGRHGIMPAQGPVIGEDGVRNVAAFVLTDLMGRKLPEGVNADIEAGKKVYNTTCFVCHGADGNGNPMLGAPNLHNPSAFIYGSSYAQLQQTIRYGRSGNMPPQGEFLGNDKAHLLAAYIWQLSHQP